MKKISGVLLLCCVVVAVGANGAPPKFLNKAAKALDENDDVQVTIYRALESYPTFESLLGTAYTDQEQQAYIDRHLALADDKVQALQFLEATAPTLMHTKLQLEGVDGFYAEQNAVHSRNTTHSKVLGWEFALPSGEEAQGMAARLAASIDELLRKDRKWRALNLPDDRYGRRYVVQKKGGLMGKPVIEELWVLVSPTSAEISGSAVVSVQINAITNEIQR